MMTYASGGLSLIPNVADTKLCTNCFSDFRLGAPTVDDRSVFLWHGILSFCKKYHLSCSNNIMQLFTVYKVKGIHSYVHVFYILTWVLSHKYFFLIKNITQHFIIKKQPLNYYDLMLYLIFFRFFLVRVDRSFTVRCSTYQILGQTTVLLQKIKKNNWKKEGKELIVVRYNIIESIPVKLYILQSTYSTYSTCMFQDDY